MMKPKFISKIQYVVAIMVAAVLAIVVGLSVPFAQPAKAAGEPVSVLLEVTGDGGGVNAIAGGTITVKVTVHANDTSIGTWDGMAVYVDCDHMELLSFTQEDDFTLISTDFSSKYDIDIVYDIDTDGSIYGIAFNLSSKGSSIPVTQDFVGVVTLHVQKDVGSVQKLNFTVSEEGMTGFTLPEAFLEAQAGDLDLRNATKEISFKEASSVKTIDSISVGTTDSVGATATKSGNEFTYSLTTVGKTLFVKPQLATSAGAATWEVVSVNNSGSVGPMSNGAQKVTLGNSAQTTITIRVTAEDRTEQEYALKVDYNAPRLSGIEVNVNNTEVTKNGFDEATPFSEEGSEFTVNVPTSSATATTANITLTPTVLAGYGTQTSITVTGVTTGLTASSSVVETGVGLTVRNITNNATLTFQVKSATGTTKDYKLNFRVYSTDTRLDTFTVTNLNGAVSYNDTAQTGNSESNYHFFLMPDTSSNYKGSMDITTKTSGATITVNGEAYNSATKYDLGVYSVVVTAPAGNTQTYSVVLAKHVTEDVLSALYFSNAKDAKEDSVDGFVNVFSENSAESNYDSISNTYTGRYPADRQIKIVHFRFEMPEGKSAAVYGDMKQGPTVTVGKNEYTTFYMRTIDSEGSAATSGSFVGRIVVNGGTGSQTYTFNISIVEGKNTIQSVAINNASNQAVNNWAFNSEVTSYSLTVPYATAMLNFRVTTDASFANVLLSTTVGSDGMTMQRTYSSHTASVTLKVGINTITLYAVADNGSGAAGTRYTINITRNAASSTATLKSLTITAGGRDILENKFKPNSSALEDITYLIIDESINVDSVYVRAEPTDENARVTGTGNVQLQANAGGTMQVVSITVYAEDGINVLTYNVNIAKEEVSLNDANSINNIAVMADGTNRLGGFFSDRYEYSITVAYSIDRVYIEISATTLNPNGVIGGGYKALNQGLNVVKVYAVSQSGKVGREYTINITRLEPRGNVNLERLLIDGVPLTLREGVYNYGITRSKNEEKAITVSAFSQEMEALVTIQRGVITASGYYTATRDFRVEQGETITITITVTLDGKSSQYTLIVTRIADDASLSSMTVELNERGNFVPLLDKDSKPIDAFNPNIREYYLTIPFDTSSLLITATAIDETATVRGNGLRTVTSLFGSTPGNYNLQIAVIPLDGNIVLYTISVTRMAARTSSTDAIINIAEITEFAEEYAADLDLYGQYNVSGTVNVLGLDITFGGDKYDYVPTYKVFYNGELQDDGDGVYFEDVTLDYGFNVIIIKITATDNITTRTIAILVNRTSGGVVSATVDQIGAFGTEFTSERTDYYYTVGNKVDKLDFNLEVVDGYTYVIDENAKSLQEGLNDITVKVYDRDGIESTIKLHVFREPKGSVSSTLLVVTVVISVVEAMLLAAAVVVVIMKNNRNKQQ